MPPSSLNALDLREASLTRKIQKVQLRRVVSEQGMHQTSTLPLLRNCLVPSVTVYDRRTGNL